MTTFHLVFSSVSFVLEGLVMRYFLYMDLKIASWSSHWQLLIRWFCPEPITVPSSVFCRTSNGLFTVEPRQTKRLCITMQIKFTLIHWQSVVLSYTLLCWLWQINPWFSQILRKYDTIPTHTRLWTRFLCEVMWPLHSFCWIRMSQLTWLSFWWLDFH